MSKESFLTFTIVKTRMWTNGLPWLFETHVLHKSPYTKRKWSDVKEKNYNDTLISLLEKEAMS
jgi:hypothetical protein